MLKILIKRSKKDVLNQTKDLVSKIQDDSKSSPLREQNAVTLEDQDKSEEKQENLFLNPASYSAPLGKTREKILTLNQLKELIREIYHSKQKYDEQCKKRKSPIETMEQYLYSYLNCKYGLKTLIVEWAVGIINAIKLFKDEDHDVFLFAKILKNKCEEDFVDSQQQVRDTINAIMKLWAREKYVFKPDHQIDLMMPELKNSSYNMEFYIKVLEKLYPEDRDRVYVEMHLEEYLQQKKTQAANNQTFSKSSVGNINAERKQANTESDIAFTIFEKIVLDYQLNEHCKFLDKFTELFSTIDADTNGILSRSEFIELLFQMDIVFDEEVENEEILSEEAKLLLSLADPFETDRITYSEVVKIFTSHPSKVEPSQAEANGEQISILEKFVTRAIEQEESQKRIMIKLQERIIEESKNEDLPENNYEENIEVIEERLAKNANKNTIYENEKNKYDELQENYIKLNMEVQLHSDHDDQYDNNLEVQSDENNPDNIAKDSAHNYLAKSLDPVEEENDREDVSQRSLRNSAVKHTSNRPNIEYSHEEDSYNNYSKDEDSMEEM